MGEGVQPFLKWAGGKRWLAESSDLYVPSSYQRFVEPFLGGAAMFFALSPKDALLSDINSELIQLYEVVRDEPSELRRLLEYHQGRHSAQHYYRVRETPSADKLERAARTLYLNRTCWNGLYRVNRKGQFNVPVGTKTNILLEENFDKVADLLSRAELRCCDFEDAVDQVSSGDFLFVDPPYTVKHNMNGFVKYNETIFSWADQLRLRDACMRAARRGAYVVATNADHESVRELYKNIADYRPLNRKSVLAANSARRGATTEALFVLNC
jgi:DNA adenine methylase